MVQGRGQGRPWRGETGISGVEKGHTQSEESAAIPVSSPWMAPETYAETDGSSGVEAAAGIHGMPKTPCATRDLTMWPEMATTVVTTELSRFTDQSESSKTTA